jgi:bacterioferritin-associated ferredoxin
LLTACSALALAACGGGGSEVEPRTVTRPTIESAVADRLASRSDKVASRLEVGDACGAKKEAARLRAELTRAINGQSIPEVYLEDLSGAVNELEARIPSCEVVQPPAPDTKGKKKGKKDKHDDEDDDESDD